MDKINDKNLKKNYLRKKITLTEDGKSIGKRLFAVTTPIATYERDVF